MTHAPNGETRVGQAVDSRGNAAVDPTRNVLALVEAQGKAADAALASAVKRLDDLRVEKYGHLHELQSAELKRIDEVLKLRVDFTMQLAVAEAKRIDANLSVVESTGRARTDALFQGLTQMTERVAAVEKFQYESFGRSRVADPILDKLLGKVESLLAGGATTAGKGQGINMVVVYIFAAIAALASVAAIVGALRAG